MSNFKASKISLLREKETISYRISYNAINVLSVIRKSDNKSIVSLKSIHFNDFFVNVSEDIEVSDLVNQLKYLAKTHKLDAFLSQ